MTDVRREVMRDEAIRLTAGSCAFTYRRAAPDVLCVTISGDDQGQFGTHTLDELRAAIDRARPLEIFIDAADASTTAASVTEAWRRFLSVHRDELARVHVLVGSKFMYLNVAITQHLAGAADLVRLYTERSEFESAQKDRLGQL